ncbi:MAG: hypothetical protein KAX31_03835, partial [Thermoplasmata archaeon]|nr:hypothetical protein [Thermoplasmata archaeon]
FALVVSGGLTTGYGSVTLDRTVYTRDDQINIKVEDPNNAAGAVDVAVVSNLGDSETVTLSSIGVGSGVFNGSIMTEFGVIVAEDGILGVEDGGTITVTYSDVDPVHDSTATARIEYAGPVITNVRVEDIMGTTATVKWDTDIPSNSTALFGMNPDSTTWVDVHGDNIFTTSHALPLTGLSMDTLYYLDVASSTVRGVTTRDDYGGSHYTFSTTGPLGTMVFFVDDDDGTVSPLDGTPYNEDWENMLNAYGWTYTRWDIAAMGTPTQADMEQCRIVMWVVDEGYPQIGTADRAVLTDYLQLSPDPKLYVIGQDIGWDMCDGSGTDIDEAWYWQYLHASYMRDDADGGGGNEVGDFRVNGIEWDPISDGYEPPNNIPLDQAVYGPNRFWPDDISNNGGTITWDYTFHAGGGDAAGIRADEAQTT